MSQVNQEHSLSCPIIKPDPFDSYTLHQISGMYQEQGKSLPEACLIPLARAILSGLSRLHRQGRVYGCLTPDDVVLYGGMDYFLLEPEEIGQNKHDYHYRNRRNLYLAPEMLRNRIWTTASDIFSAGVVLGEVLLGRHPFLYDDNDSLEEIHWNIAYELPFVPPMFSGQIFDKGLLALVCAMLIKEPDQRPDAGGLLGSIRTSNEPVQLILPQSDTGKGSSRYERVRTCIPKESG